MARTGAAGRRALRSAVELGRLAAVDEWEHGRVAEIHAEGERRRHEHRQEGVAAVSRLLDRGETPTAIAKLAGVKVSDVRAVLKSASAHQVTSPNAFCATINVALVMEHRTADRRDLIAIADWRTSMDFAVRLIGLGAVLTSAIAWANLMSAETSRLARSLRART